jgi:hypothetical protein
MTRVGDGEMCSAGIVTDVSGVSCFQNACGSSVEPHAINFSLPELGYFF